MKVTQKNVRVFHIEIENEKAFLDYFRKNTLLLKEFFLLIEGEITPKIAFGFRECARKTCATFAPAATPDTGFTFTAVFIFALFLTRNCATKF